MGAWVEDGKTRPAGWYVWAAGDWRDIEGQGGADGGEPSKARRLGEVGEEVGEKSPRGRKG